MKKIFTLLFTTAMGATAFAQSFVSPGNGTTYTLADLAKIEGTGVSMVEGAWQLDAAFTISDGDILKIQNNEVVKFNQGIQVEVQGALDCAPADTALVTTVEGTTPKGFRMYSDNAKAVLKNTRFEFVGFTFGAANGNIKAENCTFYKNNASIASGAAINFSASGTGNVIDRCNFLEGATAAIGNGANTPIGIKITNSYFFVMHQRK